MTGIEARAGIVTPFEHRSYASADPSIKRATRAFYELVRRDKRMIDGSRLFVERQRSGEYYDRVHVGPDGNRVIAEFLLRAIDEDLRAGVRALREPTPVAGEVCAAPMRDRPPRRDFPARDRPAARATSSISCH